MKSALILLLTLSRIFAQESKEYTRYANYHPYCSTPQQMKQRAVPPLHFANNTTGNHSITPQLIHVTALIRHGARTPYAGYPTYQCWNNYWTDPSTSIWNCDLKTYTAPPSSDKSIHNQVLEEEADFLFEKHYDALLSSKGNRTWNELNGTCQLGQLLLRGYEQELMNGRLLRQAYYYNGDPSDDSESSTIVYPSSMRLWDMTATMEQLQSHSKTVVGDATKKIYQEPNLRYRADDEQRTLMSGQILLRGLFGPEILAADQQDEESTVIQLHTADYKRDILVINKNVCPRAAELEEEAYDSQEFRNWNESSVEVQIIRKFVEGKMGMERIPFGILDCLMTTMCTDVSGFCVEMFMRTYIYVVSFYLFVYHHFILIAETIARTDR